MWVNTGWPVTLFQTSHWHQNKGCVLVYAPYTKTQLLFRCQQEVGNYLNGHPVQYYNETCRQALFGPFSDPLALWKLPGLRIILLPNGSNSSTNLHAKQRSLLWIISDLIFLAASSRSAGITIRRWKEDMYLTPTRRKFIVVWALTPSPTHFTVSLNGQWVGNVLELWTFLIGDFFVINKVRTL